MAPRLGLLFLVCRDLHQPQVWRDFLREADGACSVFCHPKGPDLLHGGPLEGFVIAERHETSWGNISLVVAMLALLRAAMEDRSLTHFVFLSESCIPISSMEQIAAALERDGRSRINFITLEEAYTRNPDKPGRFSRAETIPHHHRVFHPQWVLLERAAASRLLAYNLLHRFEKVGIPDESYFGTVLSMVGWDLNQQVVKQDVTWTKWTPGAWHPETIVKITPELRKEWRDSGCFFARKVSPVVVWDPSATDKGTSGAWQESPRQGEAEKDFLQNR
ncbi:MAG: hypothetical protein KDN05_01925 [Verrucomicrobiae bacterium]|nr:hypothetical protein [Verrucomicrobiae bacterium]